MIQHQAVFMSENCNQKLIQADWSVKDLAEMDRKNLLGFFALLLKVDRRVNPHLYKNGHNGSTNSTNQTK